MRTHGRHCPTSRARAIAVVGVLVALTACGSDGLDPDVTIDVTNDLPPATDTRTVDPPTLSNLPVTQP